MKALNINTTEIARWLEVDTRSVRKWRNGERTIPMALQLMLAMLLAYPSLLGIVRAAVAVRDVERQSPGPKKLSCRNASAWVSRDAGI
jgi:hypothetical protein